jgi:hypothetical protein
MSISTGHDQNVVDGDQAMTALDESDREEDEEAHQGLKYDRVTSEDGVEAVRRYSSRPPRVHK